MTGSARSAPQRPTIMPLGDSAILVRFGAVLDDAANQAALSLAARLAGEPIAGVVEVVPSLISVLLRYDPNAIAPERLAGEVTLRLSSNNAPHPPAEHRVRVRFGGAEGEDLAEVAATLRMSEAEFLERHCTQPLRVLTTGFAPGFVYCGFHDDDMALPRRSAVRSAVPAGSILFAAGQTAITATEVPTGWHVIGRTEFRNFDASRWPPTLLAAGDFVRFEVET